MCGLGGDPTSHTVRVLESHLRVRCGSLQGIPTSGSPLAVAELEGEGTLPFLSSLRCLTASKTVLIHHLCSLCLPQSLFSFNSFPNSEAS